MNKKNTPLPVLSLPATPKVESLKIHLSQPTTLPSGVISRKVEDTGVKPKHSKELNPVWESSGKDQRRSSPKERNHPSGEAKESMLRFQSKVTMEIAGSSHQLLLLLLIQKELRPSSQVKTAIQLMVLYKSDFLSKESQLMLLLTTEFQSTTIPTLWDTSKTIHQLTTDHPKPVLGG